MQTRCTVLGLGLSLGAALLAAGAARAEAPAQSTGPFTLLPLSYVPNANEPHVDAAAMRLHHDKHHAAYVANLNAALRDQGALAALPLQDLLARLAEMPDGMRTTLRNNAGGHANPSMSWLVMGSKGGAPTGPLLAAIDRDLGGMDAMRATFSRLGLAQFGSGFMAVDPAGRLSLTARPNQDTPLMEGGRVLLGNDVWEHACHLKYGNRRADHLAVWWNVVNWDAVSAHYAQAQTGMLLV